MASKFPRFKRHRKLLDLFKKEGGRGNLIYLNERIMQVWNSEISKELCRTLLDSMPRRIEAVIKAKGKSTKY